MIARIRLAWAAAAHTWGMRIVPAFALVPFATLRLAMAIGMALDPLFFPKLRRTTVRAPIIIVGNPRTGTTFLHRFLADNRFGAGLQLWRMVYPSLLVQKVLRPFIPALERVSPAKYHKTVAHDTDLESVETDDVSVTFRYFDGFFLYGFLLAWHPDELRDLFDPRLRDTAARDFAWLDALWRRSMVHTGQDRVVAKLFSLGPRTPRFLELYPDAKILFMVRDPLAVIPSGLSLVTGVLDKAFGFWSLAEPVRKRYIERLYGGLVMLMQRFHEDWTTGRIPKEKVLIVRFDRMMADFEGVMGEICDFVGHAPDEALQAEIRRTAEKQRRYGSPHEYDLERFGLDAERIRKDCHFVYESWLP